MYITGHILCVLLKIKYNDYFKNRCSKMKKKSLGAINSLGLAKPRHLNLAPLVEFRYPTRVIKNGSVKIS